MKKSIYLLLLCMLLSIDASAHDFQVDGIYYNILNEKEVSVTYKGISYSSVSNEYTGDVVIPETVTFGGVSYTVTFISAHAFRSCSGLNNITISNSVSNIGSHAFYNCSGLRSIFIGKSVNSIGELAFYGCNCLNKVSISDLGAWCNINFSDSYYANPLSVANHLYIDNLEVVDLVIPNSVQTISDYAFNRCTGIKSVTLGDSVITIGKNAFAVCPNLSSVVFSNSVISIGSNAFEYCSELNNVTIGKSVTSIGVGAFMECTNLKSVTISESVTSIGMSAFLGCSQLESVNIPKSVTYIGEQVFRNCHNISSIIVASDNPYYDSRDFCDAIIRTETNSLISGCKKSFIPNTITSIGADAFWWVNLISVNIPNSVTKIGSCAFQGGSIYYLSIPCSVTKIGNGALYRCSISNLILSGEGNWQAGSLGMNAQPILYLNSQIDSIEGLDIKPKAVYSFALTPPVCDDNTFQDYSGTLHVPAASLAAYFTADYWCNFTNIVGDAVEPEEVNINYDSIEVNIGTQFNLTASVLPANASLDYVTWRSTNPNVATVYGGEVIAMGVGECDIIVNCFYRQAICHVVVNDTTVYINLDQQEAMLLPNHMLVLTPDAPSIILQEGFVVSSSDPSVAAARVVNNKVQVVGIKEGTTTITVGSVDGTAIPATCLITVYTEPGDLDCDGFVNISDVTSLIDYLLSDDDSQISTKNADVNGDESINISDVTTLIDILLSGN